MPRKPKKPVERTAIPVKSGQQWKIFTFQVSQPDTTIQPGEDAERIMTALWDEIPRGLPEHKEEIGPKIVNGSIVYQVRAIDVPGAKDDITARLMRATAIGENPFKRSMPERQNELDDFVAHITEEDDTL
jgi:hypothetical protein